MKSILIPEEKACGSRILPFYLAAEEWVATHLPPGDWFFAWQVPPTVICGRHQDMPLEVDLDYARAHDINVWRRKSGGGCVYADWSNVMFSFITSSIPDVSGSFRHYTDLICSMLASLGIESEPTGRNDVAIRGRKVAGNSYYRVGGRSIVHGTMLYDADFSVMSQVLTPSRAKLLSKGVQSVPARVTTLKAEGLGISCGEFVRKAVDGICKDGSYSLTETDMAEIEEIEQTYLTPEFLRREGLERLPVVRSRRLEGVGEVTVSMRLDTGGRIEALQLIGDFFGSQDDKIRLQKCLRGVPCESGAIEEAIVREELQGAVRGLSPGALARMITEKEQNY